MPLAFVLPRLAQRQESTVDLSLNPKDYKERDLRRLGFEISSDQLPEGHKLALGGWSVATRVSVIRITTMKLVGIGIVAALCAINSQTGRYTSQSCAMCAAVNFVAAYHYSQIWKVRKQTYGGSKYAHYTAVVGGEGGQIVDGPDPREKAAVFMQEEICDWTRASDWVVTLVIMSLDIGHMREYMYYASAGKIPLPPVSKEWAALAQAAMMLFYMVYRFGCNEARPFYDAAKADAANPNPYTNARVSTRILAFGSFFIACVFFVFALLGAIGGLPSTEAVTEPSLKSDIICLWFLTLTWIGYPLVGIAARVGHIGVPGDEYSATWSLVKDWSYSVLDISSKGGLAVVVVLKTFWMTAAEENALVEAGKLLLAGVNGTGV
jgi:hypothetical protein